MNMQQGKITFMSLIVFCILVLGGFMAFKYIGTGIEKKQIKKEVFDTLGSIRGSDSSTTPRSGRSSIEVLEEKVVEILEVFAELGQEQGDDLLFLQIRDRRSTICCSSAAKSSKSMDEMENYGG